MATTIPQRELRNQIGAILRRAEAGELFTVTVDGRPVAQLSALPEAAAPVTLSKLREALALVPADGGWAAELAEERARERDAAVEPWD